MAAAAVPARDAQPLRAQRGAGRRLARLVPHPDSRWRAAVRDPRERGAPARRLLRRPLLAVGALLVARVRQDRHAAQGERPRHADVSHQAAADDADPLGGAPTLRGDLVGHLLRRLPRRRALHPQMEESATSRARDEAASRRRSSAALAGQVLERALGDGLRHTQGLGTLGAAHALLSRGRSIFRIPRAQPRATPSRRAYVGCPQDCRASKRCACAAAYDVAACAAPPGASVVCAAALRRLTRSLRWQRRAATTEHEHAMSTCELAMHTHKSMRMVLIACCCIRLHIRPKAREISEGPWARRLCDCGLYQHGPSGKCSSVSHRNAMADAPVDVR
mmetsp:Transcript_56772/g.130371  ORF Transcript_56772/g.130371 Transcript_56772/m.130371 type:complete len:334 (-) Transcript_56772:367-1368(-)